MSTSLQCVLRSDVARLYRRISKRLAVETTSLYCSCFITPSHHSCSLAWPDPRRKREGLATPDYRSCSSLLKSTHAISIDFAEMHADHIVSSGSPHNNVLHFSSYNNIITVWPAITRPSPVYHVPSTYVDRCINYKLRCSASAKYILRYMAEVGFAILSDLTASRPWRSTADRVSSCYC